MEEKIKVYVKINTNNEIIDINSSIFITNLINWIEIDSGYGDKIAHAQSHYFDKPICDEEGKYNYQYIDNKVVYVGE